MPFNTVNGCCVWTPTKESAAVIVPHVCEDACTNKPTNSCGITTPVGSGTLAGCKSTTLPHFGVVLGTKDGTCHKFGYYTSGNTTEYENLCGDIDKLTSEEIELPCETTTVFTTEACDCFENKEAVGVVDADKLAELEALIAANVDNTVVETKVLEDGTMVYVLEDGTEVPVPDSGAVILTEAEAEALYVAQ